jgi:endoglucanase
MKRVSLHQAAFGVFLLAACGSFGCGENGQNAGTGGAGNTGTNPGGSGGKPASGGVIASGGGSGNGGISASESTAAPGGTSGVASSGVSGGITSSGGTSSLTSSGGTTGVASSGGTTSVTSSGGTTRVTSSGGTTGVASSGGTTGVTSSGGSGGIASSGVSGGSTGAGGAGGTRSSGGSGGAPSSGGSGGIATSGGVGGTRSSGGVGGATSSGGAGGRGGSGGVTSSGGTGGVVSSTTSGGGTSSLPWLTVVGNKLQDPTGKQVILRGVSIEGLTQQSQTSLGIDGLLDKITNKNDVTAASTPEAPGSPGWYTKIVRLPADPPGTSATYLNNTLKPAVDYATKVGLYAIIDLHYVASPYTNQAAVSQFWTQTAPVFSSYSNVFYEVFNESSVQDSWATYKATMQGWVNTIRGLAPKNIIISGSPSWDQQMGDAATNPLTGGNIMYSVHMYAQHYGNGNNSLTQNAAKCAAVNPVIMTEWGYCACSSQPGNGTDLGASYGKPMLTWLEGLGGSWTAWCASNSWLPDMFDASWNLLLGPSQEGGFVKDWLYTKKDQNSVN